MRAERLKHFQEEECLKETASFRDLAERHLKSYGVVLDIGTGAGYAAIAVAGTVGKVIATDVEQDLLNVAEAKFRERGIGNVELKKMPAERLSFPDESFDGVMMRYTLHHCDDAVRALAESHRVLKPGGVLLMADAFFPEKLVRFWSILALLRHGKWCPYFTYRQHMDMFRATGFAVRTMAPKLVVQKLDDFYASAPEHQREPLRILIGTLIDEERRLMHFSEVDGKTIFAYDGFELVADKAVT